MIASRSSKNRRNAFGSRATLYQLRSSCPSAHPPSDAMSFTSFFFASRVSFGSKMPPSETEPSS
jgi:hypothetical protein